MRFNPKWKFYAPSLHWFDFYLIKFILVYSTIKNSQMKDNPNFVKPLWFVANQSLSSSFVGVHAKNIWCSHCFSIFKKLYVAYYFKRLSTHKGYLPFSFPSFTHLILFFQAPIGKIASKYQLANVRQIGVSGSNKKFCGEGKKKNH